MSPPNGTSLNNEDKYAPLPTSPPEEEEEEEEENGDEEKCDCICSKNAPSEGTAVIVKPVADEDDVIETELVVPPDGGWGWVVVMGSFACNMIVDGIIFSFGMFLTEIARTFGVSTAQVALVGSLLSGFYLIAGPFASALSNRFGFRTVAITGSVLGAAAFVLSYFATSVEFLCISYGIIGG